MWYYRKDFFNGQDMNILLVGAEHDSKLKSDKNYLF